MSKQFIDENTMTKQQKDKLNELGFALRPTDDIYFNSDKTNAYEDVYSKMKTIILDYITEGHMKPETKNNLNFDENILPKRTGVAELDKKNILIFFSELADFFGKNFKMGDFVDNSAKKLDKDYSINKICSYLPKEKPSYSTQREKLNNAIESNEISVGKKFDKYCEAMYVHNSREKPSRFNLIGRFRYWREEKALESAKASLIKQGVKREAFEKAEKYDITTPSDISSEICNNKDKDYKNLDDARVILDIDETEFEDSVEFEPVFKDENTKQEVIEKSLE